MYVVRDGSPGCAVVYISDCVKVLITQDRTWVIQERSTDGFNGQTPTYSPCPLLRSQTKQIPLQSPAGYGKQRLYLNQLNSKVVSQPTKRMLNREEKPSQ